MNLQLYIFLSPTHKTKTNFLALSEIIRVRNYVLAKETRLVVGNH